MENALRACCKGIKIGKILIHKDAEEGEQVCNPTSFPFFKKGIKEQLLSVYIIRECITRR
jgi:hypothetical protein